MKLIHIERFQNGDRFKQQPIFVILRDNGKVILWTKLTVFVHWLMCTITLLSMSLDRNVYLAILKGRPPTFISHSSRFQTITVERNVETSFLSLA